MSARMSRSLSSPGGFRGTNSSFRGGDSLVDSDLAIDLIQKIQIFVWPRRIRVREFFYDFDGLRSGRCTKPQFARAMNVLGMPMSEKDVDALTEHFTEDGPNVQRPQVVNYIKFCQAVEEIFNRGSTPPLLSSSPSSTTMNFSSSFVPQSVPDEDQLMHVMHRLAMLCKTRGVVLKYCFTDFERAYHASPSRPNRRMGGKVTVNQFLRLFPFKKEMNEKDLRLLVQRYTTENGDLHFMAMHNDVSEVLSSEMPPFPTSPLVTRPDSADWTHHQLSPVEKIQSKVVEKRVRMYEHFQDFDALRKGFCTVGQLKTVFTILDLGKEIDKSDFDTLVVNYVREDGMFCYAEFCGDVDRAFTTPHLERDPMATISMPDPTSTAPARRNKQTLDLSKRKKVYELEEKIRSRIQMRRILLIPTFQDMDKINRGHITRMQFSRVMHMLGFELTENDINRLAGIYCDLGNHLDFNYLDFCKSVDPPDEEIETAAQQAMSPHVDAGPSKYFCTRGLVMPRDYAISACG